MDEIKRILYNKNIVITWSHELKYDWAKERFVRCVIIKKHVGLCKNKVIVLTDHGNFKKVYKYKLRKINHG